MNEEILLEEELERLDLNKKEDFKRFTEIKRQLYLIDRKKAELLTEQIINDLEEG